MDTVLDILKSADKDINSMKAYIGNHYLRNLIEAAFLPEKKFILPEGTPPFKVFSGNAEVTKGVFWQICKKLDIFQRADVKSLVRERQFINAIESVSKEDADILLAVKDQTLSNIFPNITVETLNSIGYFNDKKMTGLQKH